ncbi:MAG: creatininase family protein [Pseudomonadota bacterium]
MDILNQIVNATVTQWLAILVPNQRIFLLYLLSAFFLSIISYLSLRALEVGSRPDVVKKGFVKYVFDRDVFLHRSSIQDYKFFAVNSLIYFGLISQLLVGMHTFANLFIEILNAVFGTLETPAFAVTPFSVIAYTVIVVLCFDFAIYLLHYLHHRLPLLWEFHKVHHSAEVLTPMTLYRMHPVDMFLTGSAAAVLTGMAFAGFFYLTGKEPSPYTLFHLNVIVFAFYIVGYNLRHSHIWLNYPKWVSYVFVSPAQHQIHHSIDPKHFDKNMGLIFSFWDNLFGTLYIPKSYEKLRFGLSEDNPNPYLSVKDLYIKPFQDALAILKRYKTQGSARLAFFAVLFFVVLFSVLFVWERFGVASQFNLPSVHTEGLTWTEVAKAQQNGYDTVIIPTGGTEQNGPHVILGKHNYIIKYTSSEIAKRIGNTLVAPVMAYVPEGDITPKPTRHMRFSGTVSLHPDIFERVLEAAAKSYKAHGFKRILIVGDSFDSMAVQDKVAKQLDAKWSKEGVRVFHIDQYYRENGQIEWLKTQGYRMSDIGSHAGIRDTSELLAVYGEGVRSRPLVAYKNGLTGSNGKAMMASQDIGQKMLELKIEAAIRQIQGL